MPELPEVETTRRGLEPHIKAQKITKIVIRQASLRWPIPLTITKEIANQVIKQVDRRGKYLLIHLTKGTLIIHLGMSGSLRIIPWKTPPEKHDHFDLILANNISLRFTDPRRFGCLLWTADHPNQHPLLKQLGPEPLSNNFTATYLYQLSRKRKTAIKKFIMDSHVIVGVGNIYANEALFQAGINPTHKACSISADSYEKIVASIKQVLAAAIQHGGTTIRNFMGSDHKPGYFKQKLYVYGRGGLACKRCNNLLTELRLDQRTTIYCKNCQQ